MKLTKVHIGGLFTTPMSDGIWVYQLVDVKKGWLLLYDLCGEYYKEEMGADDWIKFVPKKHWPKVWIKNGWAMARGN